jgi:phage terminase large subunit-like protein
MVTFDPDKGKSPDRVDALVWGLTELMVKNNFEFSI